MGHCQWSIKCQILYMKRNYLLYGSVKIYVILLLYDAILQIIMHHIHAEDLDLVIPSYNLIEYSWNYFIILF